MEILLRPAEAIPELFTSRLESRREGTALVLSMTVDFADNPITEGLLSYGESEDVFAVDHRGHEHGFTPLFLKPEKHAQARAEFEEQFAGQYVVLGTPQREGRLTGSLLERSHIKAYEVGGKMLSLGDVNCARFCFDSLGLMVDFESERYSSFLANFIESSGNFRDREEAGERFELTDYSEILIDYGKKGESVVLDSLLDDLQDETLVAARLSSSYVPDGRLDELLHYHERSGRDIAFYANHPSKFRSHNCSRLERYMQVFNSHRTRTTWVDLRPDKFNHLKAAVLEYEDGSKVGYVASNTFSGFVVRAGTAETALRTTDPELIGEIEAYMLDNLGVPDNDKGQKTADTGIF